MTRTGLAILWALKQVGRAYRMGAEVPLLPDAVGDIHAYADVVAYDCSELVQVALWVAGVKQIGNCSIEKYDGAAQQYLCARPIAIPTARNTPGALVFVRDPYAYPGKANHIGHVAMVIAPGYVVEARGHDYGVCISMVRQSFNLAAKVEELAWEIGNG